MLRRSNHVPEKQIPSPLDEATHLLEELQAAAEAIQDPEIEAKVCAYFDEHPNYSRDLIHVAAVVSQFKAAKDCAQAVPAKTAKAISQRV
jgi:hypothetical protein